MSKLKVFRVTLTQTHEFTVAAHDLHEARAMLEDPERFTYDFQFDEHSTFQSGGRVYYNHLVTEDLEVSHMWPEEAVALSQCVNLEETEGGDGR